MFGWLPGDQVPLVTGLEKAHRILLWISVSSFERKERKHFSLTLVQSFSANRYFLILCLNKISDLTFKVVDPVLLDHTGPLAMYDLSCWRIGVSACPNMSLQNKVSISD